jgi:hypothetical protein
MRKLCRIVPKSRSEPAQREDSHEVTRRVPAKLSRRETKGKWALASGKAGISILGEVDRAGV